jgi:hypothetical protein
VTGEVDPSALDDLVGLCVELAKLDHQADQAQPGPGPDRGQAREMLQHAINRQNHSFLTALLPGV